MKKIYIASIVLASAVVLAGAGVLIWYLVTDNSTPESEPIDVEEVTFVELEGSFGDIQQRAGYTRIPNVGDVYWWFYPTLAVDDRPIILWLDGVTDVPSSLSANLCMFGPYDINLNRRNDSWVEDYNLLFIDAPLGAGFSYVEDEQNIPRSVEDTADILFQTLDSFHTSTQDYSSTPLFVIGQGHGAPLAAALALRLQQDDASHISENLKGVALGNGVISPGLALSKLGFYLEELAYIDGTGRNVIESLNTETEEYLSNGDYRAAFDNFLSLDDVVNNEAGAVAVNLRHIVERLTRSAGSRGYFGQYKYLQQKLRASEDLYAIMDNVVAPALGISSERRYDSRRQSIINAFRDSYMVPSVSLVERLLQETDLIVTIYNGNLDAVSNTPGQLEWVNNLQWNGQEQFLSSPREPLVLNFQLEGYYRETERLKFYWINVAGQPVPLDNPVAMRRVLRGIAGF